MKKIYKLKDIEIEDYAKDEQSEMDRKIVQQQTGGEDELIEEGTVSE
jgi:hypothetical protein